MAGVAAVVVPLLPVVAHPLAFTRSDTFLLFNTPVALAVTMLSVAAPLFNVDAIMVPVNIEFPVTPNVPPILVLPLNVLLPAIV